MLRAPWEMFSNASLRDIRSRSAEYPPSSALTKFDEALEAEPVAAAQQPELPRSPAARRALAYQTRKRELSEAWLAPRRVLSPWEQATQTPRWPQTFAEPFLDPTAAVTLPVEVNKSKGAGVVLSPWEVERYRAAERAAFAERLRQQWRWNIAHL